MLSIYFGELRTGRLRRLAYLGWALALGVLGAVVVVGIGFTIGAAEQAVGGNVAQVQALLLQRYGLLSVIGAFAVVIGLGFANLNIIAKRLRDMGLPGWWGVLGIAVLGILTGQLPELGANVASAAVWLSLLLVPTNTFAGTRTSKVDPS